MLSEPDFKSSTDQIDNSLNIMELPDDMLREIAKKLDVTDYTYFSSVTREMKEILDKNEHFLQEQKKFSYSDNLREIKICKEKEVKLRFYSHFNINIYYEKDRYIISFHYGNKDEEYEMTENGVVLVEKNILYNETYLIVVDENYLYAFSMKNDDNMLFKFTELGFKNNINKISINLFEHLITFSEEDIALIHLNHTELTSINKMTKYIANLYHDLFISFDGEKYYFILFYKSYYYILFTIDKDCKYQIFIRIILIEKIIAELKKIIEKYLYPYLYLQKPIFEKEKEEIKKIVKNIKKLIAKK